VQLEALNAAHQTELAGPLEEQRESKIRPLRSTRRSPPRSRSP
jgi:hypothetical protein